MNLPIHELFIKCLIRYERGAMKVVVTGLSVLFIFSMVTILLPFQDVLGMTIPVGDGPVYVAIDENTNTLFVVNQFSNDVTVIDANTNTIITTINVGTTPSGAEFIPTINLLYVLNQATFDISVIDPNTNSVVKTIPLGTAPFGQEFNPSTNLLYIGNPFTNTVQVIDVTTDTIIQTITVGISPTSIQLNSVTNRLYVGNLGSSTISVIDGNTNTVEATITIPGGVGLVGIDENTNTIYVPEFFSNQLVVVDGTTNNIIESITVGASPRRAIFDHTANMVYTQSFISETFSIIDPTINAVIATIPVDSPFAMNFNPNTNTIYVTNQESDTITIVDLLANAPPTANAGVNQLVLEGTNVQLDGSGSSDPDGDPLSFKWRQISGTPVILSDDTSITPTFVAPDIDIAEALTFELTVNDGTFDSSPDTVTIVINEITNFQINLSQTSSGALVGDVNIGEIKPDVPIILDFIIPEGSSQIGKLDKTFLTPNSNAPDVSFNFEILPNIPSSLPNLPIDDGLFFDIEPTGADFSTSSSFPENELPRTQFFVSKQVIADNRFSDECPITPIFLLNEVTNEWEQLGDPQEPNTNRVFVTDSSGNQVSIVDITTNEIIETIPVGPNPRATAFNPNTNQLYVSNFGSNTITVIDTTTNTIIDTIVNGGSPFGIDIDIENNIIYVANSSGDITVIDGSTNTVSSTITVPGVALIGITLDLNNQKAFVTDLFTKTISVIDLNSNTLIDTIDVDDGPATIAINPFTNTAYASMFLKDTVFVIDTTTNNIIKTIKVGSSPSGTLFNPNNNKVYVANTIPNSVSVIDTLTNNLIKTIPVGNSPFRLDLIQSTNRIYVSNSDSGSITVIDGNTDTVIGTIDGIPGTPFAITANPNVSNPVRDPFSDITDNGSIVECSYIAGLPHLSKFSIGGIKALALGALATGGGSSSTGGSAPSLDNIAFDGVSTISENGTIEFGGILIDEIAPVNNIPSQTVETGEHFELRLPFFEDNGIGSLQHVAVYFLQGDEETIYDSKTNIIYEPNSPVEYDNPIGLISNVTAKGIAKSAYSVDVVFGMTFNFPTEEPMDVIVRSWDKHRRSSDIRFNDLLLVVESDSKNNLPLDTSISTQQSWSKSIQSSLTKSTTVFKESYEGSQITFDLENGKSVTKLSGVPIWVKNNAYWWSEEKIDDDDFVAGIQHLIDQNIMTVPQRHVVSILETPPPIEIPEWVKNNASWWSKGEISDDEFIQSIQWLIEEGIMRV